MKNNLRNESAARLLDRRVTEYFGPVRVTVAETFTPGTGWQSWARYRKGVTFSWVRKLRQTGVTTVALTDGHRTADFQIAELTSARR